MTLSRWASTPPTHWATKEPRPGSEAHRRRTVTASNSWALTRVSARAPSCHTYGGNSHDQPMSSPWPRYSTTGRAGPAPACRGRRCRCAGSRSGRRGSPRRRAGRLPGSSCHGRNASAGRGTPRAGSDSSVVPWWSWADSFRGSGDDRSASFGDAAGGPAVGGAGLRRRHRVFRTASLRYHDDARSPPAGAGAERLRRRALSALPVGPFGPLSRRSVSPSTSRPAQ